MATVPKCQLSMPSFCGRLMSTSERWDRKKMSTPRDAIALYQWSCSFS